LVSGKRKRKSDAAAPLSRKSHAALGSLPSVALSSARAKHHYFASENSVLFTNDGIDAFSNVRAAGGGTVVAEIPETEYKSI